MKRASMFECAAAACLATVVAADARAGDCQTQKLTAFDGAAGDGFGGAVTMSGTVAIIGAPNADEQAINAGAAYVYRHTNGTWDLEQKLLIEDGAIADAFGNAVAIDGDVAIVAARLDDNDNGGNSGAVYIFRYDGTWEFEQKLIASDGGVGDWFGWSVAISSDVAIAGAVMENDHGTQAGAAYVFRYDPNTGTWSEDQKLTAPDAAPEDTFGYGVAVTDDAVFVTATGDDDLGQDAGAAYVFLYDAAARAWTFEQKLLASDGAGRDIFGSCVAVDGVVVIGPRWKDDYRGSAYAFRYDAGEQAWTEEQKLTASDASAGDYFGFCAAVSGDAVVVGAGLKDAHTGTAYVYRWDGTSWNGETKLSAADGDAGDLFGVAAALSGEKAIVGAPHDDDNGADSGSAYAFDLFVCMCLADLDDSGAADFGDILAILAAWDNPGGPEDLDHSGLVDFGDVLKVLAEWGPCS